jgi:hypothetical protein
MSSGIWGVFDKKNTLENGFLGKTIFSPDLSATSGRNLGKNHTINRLSQQMTRGLTHF